MKTQQLIGRLKKLNPQLVVELGGHHYKLYIEGQLIGILPVKLAKEGLAVNSKCQLRRAGLRVP